MKLTGDLKIANASHSLLFDSPTAYSGVTRKAKCDASRPLDSTALDRFVSDGVVAVSASLSTAHPFVAGPPMRILRIVRGVVMTALTWATVWVPASVIAIGVSSLFRTGPALGMSLTRFVIIQATLGAINGGVFASALAIVGRRRTFSSLSMPVAAACGAAAATLVPVLVRVALSASLYPPATVIVSTLLTSGVVGATCATLTLAMARRAPALPDRNESAPQRLAAPTV